MNFEESVEFGREIVGHSAFTPKVGIHYFLVDDERGYLSPGGVIDSIHPEDGPMSGGAIIEDGWIPDLTNNFTFDLCIVQLVG